MRNNSICRSVVMLSLLCCGNLGHAEIKVVTEQLIVGSEFAFEKLPSPSINDAGAKAIWRIISGEADVHSAKLEVLFDGRVPTVDDAPRSNFFFAAGSEGGMLLADFGKSVEMAKIGTYSRHHGDRAPQVYWVYGSNGQDDAFDKNPDRDADLERVGWKNIAIVDTRSKADDPGGRHGVSISDPQASIGNYRYLLFDIRQTEDHDRFGLTFFSEIDVVQTNGPDLKLIPTEKPIQVVNFRSDDGNYRFQIDSTDADDLHEWSKQELAPVVSQWYPKIVKLINSQGDEAPLRVTLHYREGMDDGIPAVAMGSRIYLNAPWFRKQLKDEAKGCVVHELVHVVQGYSRAHRLNPSGMQTPGWFVEGMADYVRWYLFEPEKRGALVSPQSRKVAVYNASYRTSANFMDWVVRTHGKDVICKLHSAARKGKYDDALWETYTNKPVIELETDWRNEE